MQESLFFFVFVLFCFLHLTIVLVKFKFLHSLRKDRKEKQCGVTIHEICFVKMEHFQIDFCASIRGWITFFKCHVWGKV